MLDNLNSNFESSKAQRPDANDDEVEIDLLEIFYALKKKILLVLMVALAGGCIAAAYTQFLMTPIYSSTSSILVLSKETTLTSLADLQLGASLTSDYTVLIPTIPANTMVTRSMVLTAVRLRPKQRRRFLLRLKNLTSLRTLRPATLKQAWQTAASGIFRTRFTPPL